jgi:tetratricopeptide (TPR) repeat protein
MAKTRLRYERGLPAAALAMVAAAALAAAPAAAAVPQPAEGRVLTVEGSVDLSSDRGTSWQGAAPAAAVYAGNLLRTGRASRAAVLLRDETQLRVNAHSVLEIKQVAAGGAVRTAADPAAASTGIALASGEAWLRSKNRGRGLQVTTPAATAAIRGTEVNLRVEGERAEVIVVDGLVEFFNEQGSVSLGPGEGGRAEVGKAPVKFAVVNPEDAVQWVLFYPDWASGGRTLAPEVAAAAEHLASGAAAPAVESLERALAADPSSQDALAMLALVRVTQNQVAAAAALVDRSLALSPDHPSSRLVAAKVAQARFELDAALAHARAAAALDPGSVEAAATVAELLYGSGETERAAAIAAELRARHPDDARALTLHGFVLFGLDRIDEAEAALRRALELDPTRADAHLGLGLAHFNRRRDRAGLEELLAATALEPRLSLYQSYLGKAYHQLRRFAEAEVVLSTAKRLDPRDPTPHLYQALIARDLNRHREAVDELHAAIAKNGHRAVYRSRLLLDQDAATRNVSLAQVYSEVGFDAYGAHLASESIDRDYANSSAHLFAAGTLIALPDRHNAAGSELLTARLLLPVNQNSFNSFNEYTSLYEAPRADGAVRGDGGEDALRRASASSYGGSNRAAYFALLGAQEHGDRLGPNSEQEQTTWNLLGKLAVGRRGSLLFDTQGIAGDGGEPGTVGIALDPDSTEALPIRLIRTDAPDLDDRFDIALRRHFLGFHQPIGSRQHLLLVASRIASDFDLFDPSFLVDDLLGTCSHDSFSDSDDDALQGLYHAGVGRSQLFLGFEMRQRDHRDRDLFRCPAIDFTDDATVESADELATWYGRWTWRSPGDAALLTLGLRRETVELEESFVTINPLARRREWSPQLGLRWRLTPESSLRLAVFRNLAGHNEDRLEPSLLAGFAVRRVEDELARRDEADLAWDRVLGAGAFLSVGAFYREVDAPIYRILNDDTDIERGFSSFEVRGARADLDLRLHQRLTLFHELTLRDIDTSAYDQRDRQAVVGLRFIHPRGLFVNLQETYLEQRYDTRFAGVALPETDIFLTDLAVKLELPRKRGRLGLNVANLFDEDFNVVVEGLSVVQRLPTRQASVFVEWLF